jgi:predicted peptidase
MKKDHRSALVIVLILAAAAVLSASGAQNPKAVHYLQVTDEIVLEESGGRMAYTVFVPRSLKSGTPAPLILALHFGGEVTPTYGRDFTETLVGPALAELEAIIVAPNCPGQGWRDPRSEDAVLKLLEKIKGKYRIDGKKTVVTGFSMGAGGTYFFAAKHPELFSAAVAVSGMPSEEDFAALQGVPLYAIHSSGDEIFPIEKARASFDKLRAAGVSLVVDVIPDVSHYKTSDFVPALRKTVPWIRKIWESPKSTVTRSAGP